MQHRTILTTLVAFCGLVAVAQARPDLNAFLNKKVTSVHGLVYQVRVDPEVSDRYQRHFSMSEEEVINYLSQLHIARLAAPLRTSIYSVPEGGQIKVHTQLLKKDTPVFEDPNGRPILLVKCGNPLTLGPHLVSAVVAPPMLKGASAEVFKPLSDTPIAPPQMPALEQISSLVASEPKTSQDIVFVAPTPNNAVILNPEPATGTQAVPTAGGPGDVPAVRPQVFSDGPSFSPGSYLAGLGGLAGGLSILSQGSGHKTPIEAVPEPASILLLAPLAGFLLHRRRS